MATKDKIEEFEDEADIITLEFEDGKGTLGITLNLEEGNVGVVILGEYTHIKEGTLTKTNATVVIEENVDYNISYGEEFWIEKYDYKNSYYKKLTMSGNNCGFNLPAYYVTPDKPLELKQDWSCMYGKLGKGLYRLVKDVNFESDIPIDENDKFYIWAEFEIE